MHPACFTAMTHRCLDDIFCAREHIVRELGWMLSAMWTSVHWESKLFRRSLGLAWNSTRRCWSNGQRVFISLVNYAKMTRSFSHPLRSNKCHPNLSPKMSTISHFWGLDAETKGNKWPHDLCWFGLRTDCQGFGMNKCFSCFKQTTHCTNSIRLAQINK